MRKLAVILAVMLVWAASGCQSGKSQRPRQQSRQTVTDTDPFFSVNYPQTTGGRPSGRAEQQQQQQGNPMDEVFADMAALDASATQMEATGPIQMTGPSDASRVSRPIAAQPGTQGQTGPAARGVLAPDGQRPANARTAAARGQGQSAAAGPSARTDIMDTVAVAEAGPQHVSLIYPSPEYGIIKLDKIIPQEVDVSVPFKYAIVMTNLTNTILPHVVVTETLATNFLLKGAVPVPQQVSENQLTWKMESLGPKASERIEITGTPASLDTLRHSTTITYGVAASSSIRVVQSTLELTRKVPMEALLGDAIQAEYIIKNTGSGMAREVTVVEPLPAGVTTTEGANEVKFEVGSLKGGQSRVFTTQLKATRTGTFVGKATAFSASNARVESVAMPVTIRKSMLAITRSGPERIYLGRTVTYDIAVENQGDGAATNTVLENVLPNGVTNIQATPVAEVSGAKLTWNLGLIPAKAGKTVRVSFKPAASGILSSTASASAHCTETTNAAWRTAVVGAPGVRLHIVDQEDPQQVGAAVTYVIRAVNEGSASDHGIQIACDIEDSLQYLSSSGPTPGTLVGHTLNLGQLRSLGPGEEVTWRVVTKALRPGSVRFKVMLSSEGLSRPIDETEATLLYE